MYFCFVCLFQAFNHSTDIFTTSNIYTILYTADITCSLVGSPLVNENRDLLISDSNKIR